MNNRFSYGIKNKRFYPGIPHETPKKTIAGLNFSQLLSTSQKLIHTVNTTRPLIYQVKSFAAPIYQRFKKNNNINNQFKPEETAAPSTKTQPDTYQEDIEKIKQEVRRIKKEDLIKPPYIPDFNQSN